jgi:hypothetical protein
MHDATSDAPPSHARVRFEIISAATWLAVGLFVLPAAIYLVGTLVLGPYKSGSGLMQFYTDFFVDLAAPFARAWIIALGPLVLVSAIRAIFVGVPMRASASPAPTDAPDEFPSQAPPKSRARVEPRLGSD